MNYVNWGNPLPSASLPPPPLPPLPLPKRLQDTHKKLASTWEPQRACLLEREMGGERVKGEGEWEGEREGVGGVNEGESCARTAVVRFSPGLARFWSTKDRFL